MLHLIPAPLHRAALNIVHRIRVVWWRVAKPRISDCRVIALDDAGRALLVRHSYGSGDWMLPGGAPYPGENAVMTARRELREEVGLELADPREVERASPDARRKHFVVMGLARGVARIDGREIIEAGYFRIDGLPDRVSATLAGRLTKWKAVYEAAGGLQ